MNLEKSLAAKNLDKLEHMALILSEGCGDEKRYMANKEIVEPLSVVIAFQANKYYACMFLVNNYFHLQTH